MNNNLVNKYGQTIIPKNVEFEFSDIALSHLLIDMISTKYGVSLNKIHVGRDNVGQLTISLFNGFHGDELSADFIEKLEEDYKDSPFYGHEDFTKNILIDLFNNDKIGYHIPYHVDSWIYNICVTIPFEEFNK